MIVRHIAFLCAVIALSVHAQSNPPAPAPSEFGKGKQGETSTSNKDSKGNQQQAGKQSVIVEISPSQIAQVTAAIEATKSNEKSLGEWIVLVIQAGAAIAVAAFTGFLAKSTTRLWRATENSIAVARTSAQAARDTADAAIVGAAPFLVPILSGFHRYPTDGSVSGNEVHQPTVKLAFQNVGRTPALIRRVGAKLLLIERDQMPPAPPGISEIPSVERSDTIATGEFAAVRRWGFERAITAAEIRDLMARAIKRHRFLRFHVIGYAVFDDVFGVRHTQRFCMKVRQENNFQRQRGGEPYNNVDRKKVPKAEPEETTPEGTGTA